MVATNGSAVSGFQMAAAPAVDAKASYQLTISVSARDIRLRDFPPLIDGDHGSLLQMHVEAIFTRDAVMSLVYNDEHKYGFSGVDRPNSLHVSRVAGLPGTMEAPFFETCQDPAELLPFLAAVDFRKLHGGGFVAQGGRGLWVQQINLKTRAAGIGSDIGHDRRFDAEVDSRTGRLLALSQFNERGRCFCKMTAEGWHKVDGIEVPETVVCELLRRNETNKRVFRLMSVRKGKPLDIRIPEGLPVQDYRKLGANIYDDQARMGKPCLYDWTGKLPPIASLTQ